MDLTQEVMDASNQGATCFSTGVGNLAIKKLYLQNNRIDNTSFLGAFGRLEEVYLDFNAIDDRTPVQIPPGLSLRLLSLRGNRLGSLEGLRLGGGVRRLDVALNPLQPRAEQCAADGGLRGAELISFGSVSPQLLQHPEYVSKVLRGRGYYSTSSTAVNALRLLRRARLGGAVWPSLDGASARADVHNLRFTLVLGRAARAGMRIGKLDARVKVPNEPVRLSCFWVLTGYQIQLAWAREASLLQLRREPFVWDVGRRPPPHAPDVRLEDAACALRLRQHRLLAGQQLLKTNYMVLVVQYRDVQAAFTVRVRGRECQFVSMDAEEEALDRQREFRQVLAEQILNKHMSSA